MSLNPDTVSHVYSIVKKSSFLWRKEKIHLLEESRFYRMTLSLLFVVCIPTSSIVFEYISNI
jgi:hypothetical protein